MPSSDSEVSFSQIDGEATLEDGSGESLVLDFVQSDVEWTEEGSPYTEAKSRNKHKTVPVLRKTGDGNVSGSMSLLVSSFRGATGVTPYEALTHTGLAAGWTSTGRGDKKSLRIKLRLNAAAADGANQLCTFEYCVPTSVKMNPSGQDGLMLLSFDFTDHEERPTWS